MSVNSSLKVVIPARFGSTRLPGKPLVNLAGKPMISWVWQRVANALPQAEIWVATDDERILEPLLAMDIKAALTSKAHESGTDRIAEVANNQGWSDSDLIINVQGDEPLIPETLLKAFADFCLYRPDFSMASVMTPISERSQIIDENIVKVITARNGNALAFSRSPLPFCRDSAVNKWPLEGFQRHIGIYAYMTKSLRILTSESPCLLERREKLEQLRALWVGIPIAMMSWDNPPPPGVDTPDDVERVTRLLRKEFSV